MNKFLAFNDGTACFYRVENISVKGDKPEDGLVKKAELRFNYETIGVKRSYEAMQANVRLDEMIRTPMNRSISSQDIVIVCGRQYRIEQVQHDKTTKPPSSRFSLSRSEADYDIKTV